ncbi:hypothetical protein BGX24_012176 [Mortierella sp. AD032]|nr:hypothetical protein BGX24_012176 [Mortierella sp. AD032]
MTKQALFPKRRELQKRNSKRQPKLDKVFDCLSCDSTKSVICKLDFDKKVGTLVCEVCPARYASPINHLDKEVDVYSDWVDNTESHKQQQQLPRPRSATTTTKAAAATPSPVPKLAALAAPPANREPWTAASPSASFAVCDHSAPPAHMTASLATTTTTTAATVLHQDHFPRGQSRFSRDQGHSSLQSRDQSRSCSPLHSRDHSRFPLQSRSQTHAQTQARAQTQTQTEVPPYKERVNVSDSQQRYGNVQDYNNNNQSYGNDYKGYGNISQQGYGNNNQQGNSDQYYPPCN